MICLCAVFFNTVTRVEIQQKGKRYSLNLSMLDVVVVVVVVAAR